MNWVSCLLCRYNHCTARLLTISSQICHICVNTATSGVNSVLRLAFFRRSLRVNIYSQWCWSQSAVALWRLAIAVHAVSWFRWIIAASCYWCGCCSSISLTTSVMPIGCDKMFDVTFSLLYSGRRMSLWNVVILMTVSFHSYVTCVHRRRHLHFPAGNWKCVC